MHARIKRALTYLAIASVVLVLLGVFGGLVVMISGIIPIKASSGHWAITAALLDFAKRRSVATHTLMLTPPPLTDPGLVLKGAGHYDFACEPCHGSPALEQPRIAQHMTPRPPSLRTAALTYDAEDLFYIVKHGIKLTGMPAWPALRRDDEVWAMVAFLNVLPTLEAAEYQRLTGAASAPSDDQLPLEDLLGPAPPVRDAITENCARCHGMDGLGRGTGAFPRIAGQRQDYLEATLRAYARGERHSGIMEPVASGLGPEDLQAIARYYAALAAPRQPAPANDPAAVARGRQLALEGVPAQVIPACRECHGPGVARNANYPRLPGQYADYITLQLELFKSRVRGGTPYQHIMHNIAGQLTDEQIRDVAQYFASLPWDDTAAVAGDPVTR